MTPIDNKFARAFFMPRGSAQSLKNEEEGSLLSKLIGRWSEIGECRALPEAFCLCSFLPVANGLLFHYEEFAPEQTQVTKADLEYLASSLIFAPVGHRSWVEHPTSTRQAFSSCFTSRVGRDPFCMHSSSRFSFI
jgi:hypothetical protein